MAVLFPTFTSLWQQAKRLLAADLRDIWQALEATPEASQQAFYDGFVYHPPINS